MITIIILIWLLQILPPETAVVYTLAAHLKMAASSEKLQCENVRISLECQRKEMKITVIMVGNTLRVISVKKAVYFRVRSENIETSKWDRRQTPNNVNDTR